MKHQKFNIAQELYDEIIKEITAYYKNIFGNREVYLEATVGVPLTLIDCTMVEIKNQTFKEWKKNNIY